MANGWNAAVVWRNFVDTATITASSTASVDTDPSLVKNEHVGKKWRSGSAEAQLYCALEAGVSLDAIGAIGLTASTIRCRVSADDPNCLTGLVFDSGAPQAVSPYYRQGIWALDEPDVAKFLRFDLVSESADYVEMGKLAVGLRSTYRYNYDYGFGINVVDPSRLSKTEGMQTRKWRRGKYRTVRVEFGWLHPDDRWGFVEAMAYEAGVTEGLLFFTNPSAADLAATTLWARRAESTEAVAAAHELYAKPETFEEVQ